MPLSRNSMKFFHGNTLKESSAVVKTSSVENSSNKDFSVRMQRKCCWEVQCTIVVTAKRRRSIKLSCVRLALSANPPGLQHPPVLNDGITLLTTPSQKHLLSERASTPRLSSLFDLLIQTIATHFSFTFALDSGFRTMLGVCFVSVFRMCHCCEMRWSMWD